MHVFLELTGCQVSNESIMQSVSTLHKKLLQHWLVNVNKGQRPHLIIINFYIVGSITSNFKHNTAYCPQPQILTAIIQIVSSVIVKVELCCWQFLMGALQTSLYLSCSYQKGFVCVLGADMALCSFCCSICYIYNSCVYFFFFRAQIHVCSI